MIAIQTKYLPATSHQGSRIKAFINNSSHLHSDILSVIIPIDYSLSDEKLHFKAVKELIKKYDLSWDISKMIFGGLNNGYVFCFPNSIIE